MLTDGEQHARAAQKAVAAIKFQIATHEQTLLDVEAVRREHAFGASIGDKDAAHALVEAADRERAATEAQRNLALALIEADRRLADAQAAATVDAEQRRVELVEKLSKQLVSTSESAEKQLAVLAATLDQRALLAREIAELQAQVSHNAALTFSRLGNAPHVETRIVHRLAAHMPAVTYEFAWMPRDGRTSIIDEDQRLFGEPAPAEAEAA